ncbi:hypothetical protein [Roseobacter sp.]
MPTHQAHLSKRITRDVAVLSKAAAACAAMAHHANTNATPDPAETPS